MESDFRYRTAGKPPQPDEQLRRLIERLAFQANRTAKSPAADAVHDLRVAIRRAERALSTFKVRLPRKAVKRIRKQLKDVLSSAGEVRDYDVCTKILSKMRGPGSAALQEEMRARRKAAEKHLQTRLKRLSLRTRLSKWFDNLNLNHPQAAVSEEMMRTLAWRTMPRMVRSLFEAGDAAVAPGSGEALHDFRILAKKFRYTLELFAPLYGRIAEEFLDEIRAVQSILGTINDYRTVLVIADRTGIGGKLQAALKRSERRKTREFREIWSQRFTQQAAARWIRFFRTGEERRIARKPVASSVVSIQKAAAAKA